MRQITEQTQGNTESISYLITTKRIMMILLLPRLIFDMTVLPF